MSALQDLDESVADLHIDDDGVGDDLAQNSDMGSDDGFMAEDDDDNLSLDGIYEPNEEPPPYYSTNKMCIVCQKRPSYSKHGKSYPTCGLTCASVLETAMSSNAPGPSTYHPRAQGAYPSSAGPSSSRFHHALPESDIKTSPTVSADPNIKHLAQHLGGHSVPQSPSGFASSASAFSSGPSPPRPRQRRNPANIAAPIPAYPKPDVVYCVMCLAQPCRDSKYVTCGIACAEKLCKDGGNPAMCDYCHRRPREPGYNQCGKNCRDSAKFACLLCKSRPKFKQYHLCGKTCKQISVKSTPLILEAPVGHATYEMVEKKFKTAWKYAGNPTPPIRKIYKIIENKSFLQPYDRYKKAHGNEVFRYHGTTRKCNLGSPGNTKLCSNLNCSLCCILRTSFKTGLAKPTGAFGAGVYSSSAANKAYSYTGNGNGAILLTKVVLGKVRMVNGWNEVMACPPGFNSVVFDRQGGGLNETIVYTDDAIRPVFLIIF